MVVHVKQIIYAEQRRCSGSHLDDFQPLGVSINHNEEHLPHKQSHKCDAMAWQDTVMGVGGAGAGAGAPLTVGIDHILAQLSGSLFSQGHHK